MTAAGRAPMDVLVTGGTGFVGANRARRVRRAR